MFATATDRSEYDARKLAKRLVIGAVGQNRAFSLRVLAAYSLEKSPLATTQISDVLPFGSQTFRTVAK